MDCTITQLIRSASTVNELFIWMLRLKLEQDMHVECALWSKLLRISYRMEIRLYDRRKSIEHPIQVWNVQDSYPSVSGQLSDAPFVGPQRDDATETRFHPMYLPHCCMYWSDGGFVGRDELIKLPVDRLSNMPERIFLVSGRRYTGKDTAADLIAPMVGGTRTSFAEALKREVAQKNSLDFQRLMTDTDYKEDNRRLLIDHGQTRRAENPNYWVEKMLQDHEKEKILVVSDWRFPTESLALSPLCDIVTIRIEASDTARESRGWTRSASIDRDASECSLDYHTFNYVVRNDGTVEELKEILKTMLSDEGFLKQ